MVNVADFKGTVAVMRSRQSHFPIKRGFLVGCSCSPRETPDKSGQPFTTRLSVGPNLPSKEGCPLLSRVVVTLLDTFEDQGVELIPRLTIPGQGSLDLFARFPSKHLFAIALRSQGKSTIFYNEADSALKIRRHQGGRGLNQWTPDHVQRLSDQEYWLRGNQIDLFGKSSRDKRRPLVKLLVLTGQTRLGKHSEHLYANIVNQKVLLLRKRASVYVLEEEQLTDFVKAWLAPQPQ